MHLMLDLGHLCVAKPAATGSGQAKASYAVRDLSTGQVKEMRVVCKAVGKEGGKEIKRSVVLRMPPRLLHTYEQINGELKAGDALDINVKSWTQEVARNAWTGADTAYFVIETDTLVKATKRPETAAKQENSAQPA